VAGSDRPDGPPSAAERRALAPLLIDPSTTAVLTDFDGTLSPIVDRPEDARPLEGTIGVLDDLARRFAVVAVISGRPASFLVERLLPPRPAGAPPGADPSGTDTPGRRLSLIGLYGLESAAADGTVIPLTAAVEWRTVVDQVAGRLRSAAPAGALVEQKGLAVTVHWRAAPEAEGWSRSAVADEASRSGLVAHAGRLSLELRPPLPVDKGSVADELVRGCTAACYLGDDLGDLPAFAALRRESARSGLVSVAVAVTDGESAPEVADAADLVVAGPARALALLGWLARAPSGGQPRAAS
jgi:trehalose 6-phosphate phosphatase